MTAIKRILIANRGEIARRIIRTAQAKEIETVAVYSDPDRTSTHVIEADVAVALGGTTSAESYLDAKKILDAAKRTNADAIHPGYGFLSENPDFAQAVIDAGLTWIGPSPESIRAMALKVEAKRIAQSASVPLVPGAEIAADADDSVLLSTGDDVGYPLLVKASAGGGGKGMRVVSSADELVAAVAAARREAQSSFGDPTVFFERYLTGARHVEVQVFGDTHGNVVHLFERECSIQRRHQKIIEESPSPGATAATLAAMYDASVSLATAIKYVGAGTVEYLVFGDGADQKFYFLEMNTRLQVEHPVTEEVTGLDLVAWQISVAQGEALPNSQSQIVRAGHAIQARLYAEDPAANYLPSVGPLNLPFAVAGCRLDAAFVDDGEVSPHYDPMIAKVIAVSENRDVAATRLAHGLQRMELAELTTNRESLVAILNSSAFRVGDTTTAFLDDHPQLLTPTIDDAIRDRTLLAATLARAADDKQRAAWDELPAGWRNVPVLPQTWHWTYAEAGEIVERVVAIRRNRDGRAESFAIVDGHNGNPIDPDAFTNLTVTDVSDSYSHNFLLEIDGLSHTVAASVGSERVVTYDKDWTLAYQRSEPFIDTSMSGEGGGPAAPVPGTVVAVEVEVGATVAEGQTLVIVEAMKMEHRIVADTDGVVDEIRVAVGDSVDAHQVLVTVVAENEGK